VTLIETKGILNVFTLISFPLVYSTTVPVRLSCEYSLHKKSWKNWTDRQTDGKWQGFLMATQTWSQDICNS